MVANQDVSLDSLYVEFHSSLTIAQIKFNQMRELLMKVLNENKELKFKIAELENPAKEP